MCCYAMSLCGVNERIMHVDRDEIAKFHVNHYDVIFSTKDILRKVFLKYNHD